MTIFSWFKSKEPEDYEQVLSALALDIQKRQTRLSDIKIRERRTTLMLTIYTLAAWVAYVGLWYTGFLSQVPKLAVAPVFIGPIIIQFSRRIVQTWYTRIENAEEKTLKDLLVKQRNKVEEIKKKTNYYTTKDLLDRYDSPSRSGRPSPGPGVANGGIQRQHPMAQKQPMTPQRNMPTHANGHPGVNKGQPSPVPVNQVQQTPVGPPRKQWYDKLADALLGEDDPSITNAANRYALICRRCFAHNGLVKPEMWEDTQYVCPKCNHFNPSVRAIKAGQVDSLSPPRITKGLPQQNLLQDPTRKAGRKSAPLHQGGALLSPEDIAASGTRRTSLPSLPPSPLLENGDQKMASAGSTASSGPVNTSSGEESGGEQMLEAAS